MKQRNFFGEVLGISLVSGIPFILSKTKKPKIGNIVDKIQVPLYPKKTLKEFQEVLWISREGDEVLINGTRLISVERKITKTTAHIHWTFESLVLWKPITLIEVYLIDHRGTMILRKQFHWKIFTKDVVRFDSYINI